MNKAHQKEVANNLRRIWERKKSEMKFTQVKAAKQLGWTQGAISQYLNNLTEMGPQAVIKMANFLDVSPVEIDPTIIAQLPNIKQIETHYQLSDAAKKKTTASHYTSESEHSFLIEVDVPSFKAFGRKFDVVHGSHLEVIEMKYLDGAIKPKVFVVKERGVKTFNIYGCDTLPPSSKVLKKFALLAIRFY